MCGAIPPLPNTSLWRGAWLSTGTTLPLPLPFELQVRNIPTAYISIGILGDLYT
jgi:hypothetical protein